MQVTAKLFRHLYYKVCHVDWNKLKWHNLDKTKLVWPFRVMCHPIAGMNELKYEGRGSLTVANLLLTVLLIISSFQYTMQGFVFNTNKLSDFNLLKQFAISSALVILFSVCGWASGTLLDGEGKFREIYITTCYAVVPQIILGIVGMVLSRVLILQEAVFLTVLDAVKLIWTGVLLIMGYMIVQQFTLKRTIGGLLLTIFFMVALLFLLVLFFSMLQQLFAFMNSVYIEINSRR